MAWTLDSGRPIYAQLVERLQTQIVSGYYPAGTKLPSVRDLAAEAAVNPNTMQRAFAELERNGLVVTQRTNGRSVTQDQEKISSVRRLLAEEHVDIFFKSMRELGFETDQIRRFVDETIEKKGGGEKSE